MQHSSVKSIVSSPLRRISSAPLSSIDLVSFSAFGECVCFNLGLTWPSSPSSRANRETQENGNGSTHNSDPTCQRPDVAESSDAYEVMVLAKIASKILKNVPRFLTNSGSPRPSVGTNNLQQELLFSPYNNTSGNNRNKGTLGMGVERNGKRLPI